MATNSPAAAPLSPSSAAAVFSIGGLNSSALLLLIFVWFSSCAVTDIYSADLIPHLSATHLTFFTSLWCAVTGYAYCKFYLRDDAPLHFCTNAIKWPNRVQSRLTLMVGCSNVAALWAMFYSFSLGGISVAYAVKTTEPLLTCCLATAPAQAVLIRWATMNTDPSSPHDASLGFWKNTPPSRKLWISVAVICLGAALISTSLHRDANSKDGNAGFLWATVGLILFSNGLFAFRTTVQKPLLRLETDSANEHVAAQLFVNVGLIGAIITAPPSGLLWEKFEYEDGDYWRLFMVGSSYYMYQVCNNYILSHVSCVTYAVAKQFRVLAIFFGSVAYFSHSFDSRAMLFAGVVGVIYGSIAYAKEHGAQNKLVAESELDGLSNKQQQQQDGSIDVVSSSIPVVDGAAGGGKQQTVSARSHTRVLSAGSGSGGVHVSGTHIKT